MHAPAFCTQCGWALGVGVGFCSQCGAGVSGSADPGPGRRSRFSFLGWVGIAALTIAVATGGTWLAVSLLSDGEEDPLALDVLGAAVPEPAVVGSFDLGSPIEIVSATVGPGGGTVESSDGLLIYVPPGAHSEETGYTVSKQEILGHDFGPGVNPVSAMYSVDNGGRYADAGVWVEVPAAVPEGGFAMGFFYDEATGGLEAMPLVGVGDGSVVVATAHFSEFFVHGVDATTFAALLAAQAAETASSTDGPVVIVDTRFRPGVDDWPFNNYGSAISPGGHCAGQSLSAMWYFVERTKAGAPALNNRYDNDGLGLTERWQDDRNGYRTASVVQVYYRSRVDDWITEFQGFLDRWRLALGSAGGGAAPVIDSWQYAAFITAMKVTGEPQYVSIGRLVPAPTTSSSTTSGTVPGSPPKPIRAGHAMVVYGADTRGLWIADPNYAGRFRRIPWDGTTLTLGPYYSGDDATTLGWRYDSIRLLGKTSLVDWNQIGLRFEDLAFGVAGDDLFPSYTLQIYEEHPDGTGDWVDLEEGYTTLKDRVRIRMERSPKWSTSSWRLTQCQGTGEHACRPLHGYLSIKYYDKPIEVDLDPGDNSIEMYLEGYFSDGWKSRWVYVDFIRVTVHRGMAMDLTVLPPTQEVEQGASAAFTIEVTNLGAADLQNVRVWVDPGGLCTTTIPSIPGNSTHTYDCTVTPPSEPGAHQYQISGTAEPVDGRTVDRTIYTQITVGEAITPPGGVSGYCGDLCDIETRLRDTVAREYELGEWIRLCAGGFLAPDDPECTDGVFREAQGAERYRLHQLADAIREEQWAFDEENSITWDERMQCLCRCFPESYPSCDVGP